MTRNTPLRFLLSALLLTAATLVPGLTASAQANESVLYSFQGGSDGYVPVGSIAFDKAGNLYGATTYTSPCGTSFQCGSVYELSPPLQGGAWTLTTIHTFQGHSKGDGGAPTGGLIQDAAGNLYGVTGYGGTGPCILLGTAVGCGTVYELIRPAQPGGTWKEKVLYSFQGNQDGQAPVGDLVFDKQGNLYGATFFGGGKGDTCNSLYPYCGTVFELSPVRKSVNGPWTEKVLYSFQGLDAGDGGEPNGGLVFDQTGAIYGTTSHGGSNVGNCQTSGCGIAFQLAPPSQQGGSWTETILHTFLNDPSDGGEPNGNPFISNGTLYGTTLTGGPTFGTVFMLTPPIKQGDEWTESIIHSFDNGTDGWGPLSLIGGPNGSFYGSAGGTRTRAGIVFRMEPPKGIGLWKFTTLYNFTGAPDGADAISLRFGKDKAIYGTTQYGGTGQACQGGCGTIF